MNIPVKTAGMLCMAGLVAGMLVAVVIIVLIRFPCEHEVQAKKKEKCWYAEVCGQHKHEVWECENKATEEFDGMMLCGYHAEELKDRAARKAYGRSLAVQVTAAGEVLYPQSADTDDPSPSLGASPIYHKDCGGEVCLQAVTEKARVLYCEDCGLRLVVPNTVGDWPGLAKHFKQVTGGD